MKKAKYDALMQCGIIKMEYDFIDGVGKVWFPDKECCDFVGCVKWFEKIDKDVRLIMTFSGDYLDTCYYLSIKDKEWGYAPYGKVIFSANDLLLIHGSLLNSCTSPYTKVRSPA